MDRLQPEHERLLAYATYDGHRLGDKLIREFEMRFMERLGAQRVLGDRGVRGAWSSAEASVQMMLEWEEKALMDDNGNQIRVIRHYVDVKLNIAKNDLNQFKDRIRPIAEQLLTAEQQQERLQAAEGPLQAQYQAAAQQLQAECGARAQQLQAQYQADAQQLLVQSGDPRDAIARLQNQIKTYVADNYRQFDDRQLVQLERQETERRAKEERALREGEAKPKISLPQRRHGVGRYEEQTRAEEERARQERGNKLVFTKPARQELNLNFGMGRKTGRRGMSPKKSPRKTRKSSPRKTRKSPKKSH